MYIKLKFDGDSMKQIKTFQLPKEEALMNDFLAKHPPESVSTFKTGFFGMTGVVHFDDQTYPDHYKAEEIKALMMSNEKQKMTTLIALSATRKTLWRVKAELNKLTSTSVSKDAEGKVKYDLSKDREEKIKAYELQITNLGEGITGLEKSVSTFDEKNEALQDSLDELDLD